MKPWSYILKSPPPLYITDLCINSNFTTPANSSSCPDMHLCLRPDYCQSCSGNKREINSYCPSDLVIVSDTHDAVVSFFDWFRRSWQGNCNKIEPHSCSGNKGWKKFLLPEQKPTCPWRICRANLRAALAIRTEKFLIARPEMDWWWCACASGWRYV